MAKSGLVDYVKTNISILDIAQQHGVQIKKLTERHAFAPCIFCGASEPKLQFYLYSNSFCCHRCRKGGTVFDFVMEATPCDFVQALEILARAVGRDISEKDKEFYEKNKDVWQIPSIYRYVIDRLSEFDIYEFQGKENISAKEMAYLYFKKRGITDIELLNENEIIYVNVKRKAIEILFQGTNFSTQAIENSSILAMSDYFYKDSILIPVKVDRKIRQLMSLSCGLVYERRKPKILFLRDYEGLTPKRVWGIDNVIDTDAKSIFITESVTDALCINQEFKAGKINTPAVAIGGTYASQIQIDDIVQIPQMKYYILFDKSMHREELAAANKLVEELGRMAYIVDLPLQEPVTKSDPKDVNDLYLLPRDSKSVLVEYRDLSFVRQLAKAAKYARDARITPPIDVDISQLIFAEFMNKRVRCEALPFSDIVSTHSVPISVRCTCRAVGFCDVSGKHRCHLHKCGKKGKLLDIELDNPEIIRFCHARREEDISDYWFSQLALPCGRKAKQRVEVTTEKTASVHQIELGPNIEYLSEFEKSSKFTLVRTYIVSVESSAVPDIEPIEVVGRVVAHPYENHEVVLLVTKFEPIQDTIAMFRVTDKVKTSLSKFQEMSLDEILEDIVHYTGIISSDEMHLAFLLTYHSCLHYHFLGADYLGCLQTLILTDSGTGKSTLGRRLVDLFKLGEIVVCETSGRTGVTYTLVSSKGNWHVRWGAMVRQDRKFLMLDEFQEFPEGESQHIKEARSSGQLRVDRAAKGFAFTRCRMLFASNPKPKYKGGSSQLFAWDYPITAVKTVFTTEADIRRLDLVVLVRGTDKTTEDLHQKIIVGGRSKLSQEDWKNSVRWAWGLGKENIILEEDAIDFLLEEACRELVEKYKHAEDIPLFTASYTKHSMLKMAIALAVLTKSTDENFEKVYIKKKHVQAVARMLDMLYSSMSCRLDTYALKQKQSIYMTNEDFELIVKSLGCEDTKSRIVDINIYVSLWRTHENWNTNMLKDACDVDQKVFKKITRIFIEHQLLKKKGTNLNKTPKMVEFIKRLDGSPKYSMVTEEIYIPKIDMKLIE